MKDVSINLNERIVMNSPYHQQPNLRSECLRPVAKTLCILLCSLGSLMSSSQISLASAAGKEFNEADAALNSAYQAVLSSMSDTKQKALFVQAQKAWIKFRDENVAFFAAHYPASKGGLFFNIQLTTARADFFKAILATPPNLDPEGGKPSGY